MISLEGTSIFRRVIDADRGAIAPEVARFLHDLDFSVADQRRFAKLSEKAQAGTLNPAERDELEGFLEVDGVLSLLRLKAERSSVAPGNSGR